MTLQEKFRTAYLAWKAATDDYDAALREVMAGRAVYEPAEMQKKIKEMARLLAEFDTASDGLVRWTKL